MTWRDDLRRVTMADGRRLIGASFRGVPFFVQSTERTGGRRTVTHEFPLRDAPYVEDLGRRARTFVIEGYVLGDDYVDQRNRLLAALEDESGPGALVHPYYGSLRAVCTGLTTREAITDGGMAVLSIEFTEAPAQAVAPSEEVDAAEQVTTSAAAAHAANSAEFEAGYDVDGLPSYALESAELAITALAEGLGAALAPVVTSTQELARLDVEVQALVSDASTLARTPGDVIGSFLSVLSSLADTIAEAPGDVVQALVDAYAADVGALARATTAIRERELANQSAIIAALRRLLAIEAARLAVEVEFTTHEEAAGVRDAVAALLDEQAEAATDAAYPSLVQLRADLVRAIPGDAVLARTQTIERPVAVPSILLAYQIYGSTERELDVVARNAARHPGFLAGSLTVVDDG